MGFKIIENNKKKVMAESDEAIERALSIVGMQVENYARNNAPVDTGRLKNSITSTTDANKLSVTIGTNVDYAPYQELGTSKMKACNGGRGFLRPAVNDHYPEYRKIFEEELRNG